MRSPTPTLHQVNLVVGDMDAAVAFYGALGVTVRSDPGEWPPGTGARHVALDNGDGPAFELDNLPMARIWHGGWRSGAAGGRPVVLMFHVGSRGEVDERYHALVAAGHPGVHEPHDAFWGARFAVVRDPDANDVGLMSPIEDGRRFTPPS
jgi:catechol 2,3-dioxygenase-like lactoylglutathione lyase family enzyme